MHWFTYSEWILFYEYSSTFAPQVKIGIHHTFACSFDWTCINSPFDRRVCVWTSFYKIYWWQSSSFDFTLKSARDGGWRWGKGYRVIAGKINWMFLKLRFKKRILLVFFFQSIWTYVLLPIATFVFETISWKPVSFLLIAFPSHVLLKNKALNSWTICCTLHWNLCVEALTESSLFWHKLCNSVNFSNSSLSVIVYHVCMMRHRTPSQQCCHTASGQTRILLWVLEYESVPRHLNKFE